MAKKKLKLDMGTSNNLLARLHKYMEEELEESVGDLKVQLFFDFIEETIAPAYFNLGIEETRKFFTKKMEDLDFEFDLLRMG